MFASAPTYVLTILRDTIGLKSIGNILEDNYNYNFRFFLFL